MIAPFCEFNSRYYSNRVVNLCQLFFRKVLNYFHRHGNIMARSDIMLPLYLNIRHLRESLGMSQEELAQKTGYKSRTSIAKIEAGKVDLSQSKILQFADALGTTTAYLMGWEELKDSLKKENLSIDSLSKELDIPAHLIKDMLESNCAQSPASVDLAAVLIESIRKSVVSKQIRRSLAVEALLKSLGYVVRYDEESSVRWIEEIESKQLYDISQKDIDNLEDSICDYAKFLLTELLNKKKYSS